MKKIYFLLLILVAIFGACKKDRDVEFSTFTVENEKIIPSYTSIEVSCKVRCSATINELYLQYDTVSDFSTYQEVQLEENEKTEVYSVRVVGLLDNTTYYVRYLAVNSFSQVEAKDISRFQTLQATVPTVELHAIADELDTVAMAIVSLKFDGGVEISRMGVCWSTDSVPTIEDKYVEYSRGEMNNILDGDSLNLNISGLEANTTYYVRAYAENIKGISYSNSANFITLALPDVKTDDVTDIQLTSVMLNGEAIFNGNDTTTEYGFCWGEESNLIIEEGENVVVMVDEDGTFTYRLLDLQDETTYYVRAYAKNKIGIVYGEELKFKTEASVLPVVEIMEVGKITTTTAVVKGNVTSDGGAEVTERGVCYSASTNPTINNSVVKSNGGLGSFEVELTGLEEGKTYYVRAYAKNKKGVAYSGQRTFMTKAITLPTIVTADAKNVESVTAVVGGNVTSDGGAEVTERGVCYSTTVNPTVGNIVAKSGTGLGSFEIELSGLKDGTTYYVRAYALNNKGVAYGNQCSFTTKTIDLPTVVTTEVKNITYDKAYVYGNVTSDGGAEVTERGVCYSMSVNPTVADTKFAVGKGLGTFTKALSNLQEGTKYYVRAYAINKKGVAYGEELLFETLSKVVDLGLSVKWASCNVGATTSIGIGKRFAWGETETKTNYDWEEYKYYNTTTNEPTKYSLGGNSYWGFVDNKSILDLEDDAATVNCGSQWRTPTEAEWTELLEKCTWTWTTQNGVQGYNVQGNNGNSIFLPVTGYKSGTYVSQSDCGWYWSSSLQGTIYSYSLFMNAGFHKISYTTRANGLSVRPVFIEGIYYYTISVNVDYNTRGTVYGGGTYLEGSEVTLTATANPGYKFKAWNDGNTNNPRTIIVARDISYTAHFEEDEAVAAASKYVDLGLSVKWATRNVGAENREDLGDVFAWGEVETKSTYDWTNYKYSAGTSQTLTKYCTTPAYGKDGFTDNQTVLYLDDDAAHVKLGENWRMPTHEEISELCSNCTWTWTTLNGVSGYSVMGRNGNSIFLPAVSNCRYWSSTCANQIASAILIYVGSNYSDYNNIGDQRSEGHFIRPVVGGKKYTISVSLNNSSYGEVKGVGAYEEGAKATLRAVANKGYVFVGWSDGSKDKTRVMTVTQDMTYTAYFEKFEPSYVDLGLSVKWAICNVGAGKPEEYGDFFAWGEVKPKVMYSWETYKYCDGSGSNCTLTKYCCDSNYGYNGFVDNKTNLDPEDDAATVNWGENWRMPTKDEMDELRYYCTWTWTTENGVHGYKIVGNNGNSIFLPIGGWIYEGKIKDVESGNYWINNSSSSDNVRHLSIDSSGDIESGISRCAGLVIRPVCK